MCTVRVGSFTLWWMILWSLTFRCNFWIEHFLCYQSRLNAILAFKKNDMRFPSSQSLPTLSNPTEDIPMAHGGVLAAS